MWNAGLDEAQAGIKIAGRNINNLRYADDTMLMAESEEELTRFWMKVTEKSEKVGLKLNIQKTKIMASGPITSWQTDGKQWKQWEILFLGAPKSLWTVTAAMNWKMLASWKKNYNKPSSILKSWDITLLTNIHIFSSSHVWMWELDYK